MLLDRNDYLFQLKLTCKFSTGKSAHFETLIHDCNNGPMLLAQYLDLSFECNEADSPTKTPDTKVKNAASQTGKQTCFIALLLLQAKNFFFIIQILV